MASKKTAYRPGWYRPGSWYPIQGWESDYEIQYSTGNVRSLDRESSRGHWLRGKQLAAWSIRNRSHRGVELRHGDARRKTTNARANRQPRRVSQDA